MKKDLLRLRVEIPLGMHRTDACEQLCDLADRLGVQLVSEHNGVTLFVSPRGDPQKLESEMQAALRFGPGVMRIARA